jgi:signal transduction histidine kinase
VDTLLGNYKISTRLWALMGVLVVLAIIAVAVFASVLNQVRINSDRYNQIVQAKDITADVLPPPLYLVETQLIVHELALGYEDESEKQLAELDKLQAQYKERFQVWEEASVSPEMRSALRQSNASASSYFVILNGPFATAAKEGDRKTMRGLLASSLEPDYSSHRESVDRVVKLSKDDVVEAEAAAANDLAAGRNLLFFLGLAIALLAVGVGVATVRSIVSRVTALRQSADVEFPQMVDRVKRSAEAGEDIPDFVPVVVEREDELADAERAFNGVVGTAVELAADQARLRRSTSEMFINLGRRNHKLLSRTLSKISELERAERDPGTLQNLFSLDHLITRMRRNAESLLVLAGTTPMRTWAQAVPVDDVLRAALSEVENYERVRVQLTEPADVVGAAASDVAHLLAELVENAISFSSPETSVSITGGPHHGGYVLYISDEGLGIDSQQLRVLNSRLASESSDAMQDSRRLGLNVVARLAARHQIEVELNQNSVGGVLVRIWLPAAVVGATTQGDEFSPAAGQLVPDPSVVPLPEQLDRPSAGQPVAPPQAAAPQPATATPSPDVLRALVSSEGPFQPDETLNNTSPDLTVVSNAEPTPSPTPDVVAGAESIDSAASPEVELTSGGLPRRVRGTNVDESLRVPPGEDPEPGLRSPEEVRTALANFSTGRKQAIVESDEHPAEHDNQEQVPLAAVAVAAQSTGQTGLTKRVRGANLAESIRQPSPDDTPTPTRTPEEVRSSLADFAAGKLAAAENSGPPKQAEDSSS